MTVQDFAFWYFERKYQLKKTMILSLYAHWYNKILRQFLLVLRNNVQCGYRVIVVFVAVHVPAQSSFSRARIKINQCLVCLQTSFKMFSVKLSIKKDYFHHEI